MNYVCLQLLINLRTGYTTGLCASEFVARAFPRLACAFAGPFHVSDRKMYRFSSAGGTHTRAAAAGGGFIPPDSLRALVRDATLYLPPTDSFKPEMSGFHCFRCPTIIRFPLLMFTTRFSYLL